LLKNTCALTAASCQANAMSCSGGVCSKTYTYIAPVCECNGYCHCIGSFPSGWNATSCQQSGTQPNGCIKYTGDYLPSCL
jgi:hypothetical protein